MWSKWHLKRTYALLTSRMPFLPNNIEYCVKYVFFLFWAFFFRKWKKKKTRKFDQWFRNVVTFACECHQWNCTIPCSKYLCKNFNSNVSCVFFSRGSRNQFVMKLFCDEQRQMKYRPTLRCSILLNTRFSAAMTNGIRSTRLQLCKRWKKLNKNSIERNEYKKNQFFSLFWIDLCERMSSDMLMPMALISLFTFSFDRKMFECYLKWRIRTCTYLQNLWPAS